jgi:hypothetical protein
LALLGGEIGAARTAAAARGDNPVLCKRWPGGPKGVEGIEVGGHSRRRVQFDRLEPCLASVEAAELPLVLFLRVEQWERAASVHPCP